MTNSSPNPPPNSSNDRRNPIISLLQRARRRSTIAVGLGSLALVILGCAGVRLLIEQMLPPLLEEQLSETLNRKVKVGKVEDVSFNHIQFGPTSIPATPTDPDNASVQRIKVNFNLLPVLFRRTLPLQITLVKPNVYLEQDEDRTWLELDIQTKEEEKEEEPLIYLDLTFQVQEGNFTALPYQRSSPVNIQIDGTGRYNQVNNQQLQYDLEANISNATAKLKGETLLETGKSQVELVVQDLILADLQSLIPNSPIKLNSGELDSNLKIELPSADELTSTRGKGKIILEGVEAEAQQLSQPLKASLRLRFQGSKVLVESGKVSLGEIVALIGGEVDWQKGYDLNFDVMPFSLANLNQTVPVSLPVEVVGKMQVKLKLAGPILKPMLTGIVSNTTTVRIDKIEFKEISTYFQANPEKFVLNSFRALPVVGGSIIGRGLVKTQLRESREENKSIDVMTMRGAFDLVAQLPTAKIASLYNGFPSQIGIGTITAQAQVQGTPQNPQASLQWQAAPASVKSEIPISGAGEVLLKEQNLRLHNTQLEIGQGIVALDGRGNLESNQWQASLAAVSVPLDPFLSLIQLPPTESITLENGNVRLSGRFDSLEPAALKGLASVALNIGDGSAAVRGQLDSGILKASANASGISLTQFVPDVTVPVVLVGSQINLSGSLQQLLAGSTPDLSNFQGNADLELAVADGKIDATSRLNNNLWGTNINVSDIDSSLLTQQLSLVSDEEQWTLPDLNAQLNLSGNLEPLFQQNTPAIIQANTVAVQLGEQLLNARGNLFVSNLTTAPDISSINLDIQARSNFNALPFPQLIGQVPKEEQFLPQEFSATGQANFEGRLQGKNLISAPLTPGNLELTGNLQLLNLSLNDLVFEPVLAGPVTVAPGKQLAIDWRGKRDVIAAALAPCTREQCLAPYLPTSFEFRQGWEQNTVIAVGNRTGDRLLAKVHNFPLSLLNIVPLTASGLPGPVAGRVRADLDLNLFTLATRGNLRIDQPAIGYIKFKEVAADFSYDNGQVQLASTTLKFGQQSLYQFQGGLNLNSGQIDGRLDARGDVQDILTTLYIYDIEDLEILFQDPNYARAAEVQPRSVGNPDAPLAHQINLLWKISQRIQQLAAQRLAEAEPTQLDLRGAYTGQIALAGTLTQPQLDLQVEGNDWQWRPKLTVRNIKEPHGPVWQEVTQAIPIDRLFIQGSMTGDVITVEPLQVNIGETVLSLAGNLSAKQRLATLEVENLSLELIRNFVDLPLDMAGKLNLKGKLDGLPREPQARGRITFVDGAINGRALNQRLAGNFSYRNAQLDFRTTTPKFIQVQATVPYPTQPEVNDQLKVDLKLGTEAFTLLGAFTQGQVEWANGEGEAILQARGRINLTEQVKLDDLVATGAISLQNATLKSAFFAEKLKVNGQIALQNQLVKVEQLEGTFAQSKLSVMGVLPLFDPLSQDEPDSSNPLTLAIESRKMNLKGLYEGKIDGQVVVTGAAISPEIGGKIRLYEGQVFLPEENSDAQATPSASEKQTDNNTNAVASQDSTPVVPKLNNFQIVLDRFKFETPPLYKFWFAGALTLNGPLDDLNNLQPEGKFNIQRGELNLIDNEFSLVPGREHTIEFVPQQGLINPNLDIEMGILLSEPSESLKILSTSKTEQGFINNEVRDDTFRTGRADTVEVSLSIEGQAADLLPILRTEVSDICQNWQAPNKPPIAQEDFSPKELQQLSTCIQGKAAADRWSSELLNARAVKLTSLPPRSQDQIFALLGNQVLTLGQELQQELQQSNQQELLQFGVAQFVIVPILQDVLFETDVAVSNVGRTIGFTDLQIFPVVQGTYQVGDRSAVDLIYDYVFNEAQVRYQLRF